MRRITVAHIAYAGLGGQANDVLNIIQADAHAEFRHTVVFVGREEVYGDYLARCHSMGVPVFYAARGRDGALSFARRIAAVLRATAADIVMANGALNVVPCVIARAAGLSCCTIVRETQANHLKNVKQHAAAAIAAVYADAFVCLTAEYRGELEQRYGRRVLRRAVVIPNMINSSDYADDRRYVDRCGAVGMVARLVSIKDYDTLIDAVALLLQNDDLRPLTLYIAGDGPHRPAIESRIALRAIGRNVVLCGALDYAEVAALMRRLDVYVHLTFGETASNSIMQAMASGLPIVASDVPGVSNMLTHGVTGLLVPPGDPKAVAVQLRRLLLDPVLRETLGSAAREASVTQYAPAAVFSKYRDLWTKLSRSSGRSPGTSPSDA